MSLRMTAAARDKLLQTGMDVRYGARPLRRALQKEIEDKLADLYLEGTFSAGDHILIDVLSGDFSFSRLKEAETAEGGRYGKHGTGARGAELWLKQKRK